MKPLSTQEIRHAWDIFWKEKKHAHLPEASLVGGKESTAMFTIAGMQQLIPYLAGKPHTLGKRLYNIQKCVRTVDIDEVGDASHLTFFHMMGNRSLGDYFKKEAVQRSREFLVDVLGFDPKKLAVTVFEGDKETPQDDETAGYRKEAGMPENRIAYMPAENNWWSPGPVGPCGPDTEIFYWVGDGEPGKKSNPKIDENNWLEIWNNVFMEFYRDEKGNLTKLKNQNVDTGMGLERMCKVLQDKPTVFETDQFASLLKIVEKYTNKEYVGNEKRMRVIVDHMRTSFFLVKEGITPSNEGRGYVVRRLMRRMYYNRLLLKESTTEEFHNFLEDIGKEIGFLFEEKGDIKNILGPIEKEITQFQKTITNGKKLIKELFEQHAKKKILAGKDIFKLYDTCGFPVELTKELAQEEGFKIDEKGFEQEMQAQQERSRQGSKDMFKVGVDRSTYLAGVKPTIFTGYESLETDDMELLKDFEVEGQRILIFKSTPFYAESGGQMGDKGVIILDNGEKLKVVDVKKYEGVVLHIVE